jgi:hypothetical protein
MPGEFYVENKAEKVSLDAVESSLAGLNNKADAIKARNRQSNRGKLPGREHDPDWRLSKLMLSVSGCRYRNKIMT